MSNVGILSPTTSATLSVPTQRQPAAPPRWHWLRELDPLLVLSVSVLSVVGTVLVWSATRERMVVAGLSQETFLYKHLLNIAVALVFAAVALRLNNRLLRVYAPLAYGLALVGLVAVLLIGSTINGSRSWIVLPAGFSLQPSEFAKPAVVLMLASVLCLQPALVNRRGTPETPGHVPHQAVLAALGLAGVVMVLVVAQKDLGTTMVVASIVFGMVAVSGASLRWTAGMLIVAALAGTLMISTGALDDYQVQRLTSFANPGADPRGAGYNTAQARIAIGSGGLTGQGLFHGPQTQGRFVPEQQTDFIFTAAGEELGFIGAGGILLMLGLLLVRCCRIAAKTPDLFNRLVVVGVVCWFSFQMFENIGMCLGLMPVTGLPLPFVSYGGSSMFANWFALGLVLSIARSNTLTATP